VLKSSIMRNSRGEEDVRYPFLTSRAAIGALVHSEGHLKVSSENDSRLANCVTKSLAAEGGLLAELRDCRAQGSVRHLNQSRTRMVHLQN